MIENNELSNRIALYFDFAIFPCRVSVGITVDAPVTAVWNKTKNIQYFKDI